MGVLDIWLLLKYNLIFFLVVVLDFKLCLMDAGVFEAHQKVKEHVSHIENEQRIYKLILLVGEIN